MNPADVILEAEKLRDRLFARAMYLTRNAADAEDLVSATFVKAFRFAEKYYEERGRLASWLFTVLQREWIDVCRARKKEQNDVHLDSLELPNNGASGPEGEDTPFHDSKAQVVAGERWKHGGEPLAQWDREEPANMAEYVVSMERILAAVERLSGPLRVVFNLDLDGCSYLEISEMLMLPIGTVRSRLHRARKILYAEYHGQGTISKKTRLLDVA